MSKVTFTSMLQADELQSLAAAWRCDVEAIEAVLSVESRNGGFDKQGFPTLLQERHKGAQAVEAAGYTLADLLERFPHLKPLLAFKPYPKGGYGRYAIQRKKFETIADSSFEHARAIAISACSWGAFQIGGWHWDDLGYASAELFFQAMLTPAGQLDAFKRYVEWKQLQDELAKRDWTAFARQYNGRNYAKYGYHWKLAKAYSNAINRHVPKKPLIRSTTVTSAASTTLSAGASSTALTQTDKLAPLLNIEPHLFMGSVIVIQLLIILLLAGVITHRYIQDRGGYE